MGSTDTMREQASSLGALRRTGLGRRADPIAGTGSGVPRRSTGRLASDAPLGTDLVMAFAAGPLPWVNGATRSGTAHQAGLAAAGLSLVAALVSLDYLASVQFAGRWTAWHVGLLVMANLGIVVVGETTAVLALRRRPSHSVARMVIRRGLAAIALGVVWAQLSPLEAVLLALPIGSFTGAETALTAETIGDRHSSAQFWRGIVVSPAHAGFLCAVVAGALLAGERTDFDAAAALLIGVELGLVVAAAVHAMVRALYRSADHDAAAIVTSIDAQERRRLAHWIHDDVCADIRGVRMRFAATPLDAADLARELDELDHRLRLRQLDEVIAGGSVAAAEILQPYVRRAQHQGVAVTEVPRLEASCLELGRREADLLRRSVAGLIANAVNAGATAVAIRLRSTQDTVVLEVEDDAGGFSLADVPAGRGIESLMTGLGPGCLTYERTAAGTRAIATIGRGRSA